MFKIVNDKFRRHPDVDIKIPKRGTKNSAGYDIVTPIEIIIEPNSTSQLIFTDICVELKSDEFLMILPRSSIGMKKEVMLCNTAGIIDSDYYNNPDNGGNIGFKLYNYGTKTQLIPAGERVLQGIILKYEHFEDEEENQKDRIGGFGSTK